jgi:ACS family pantothenate transporter-like MFS transporter
MKEELNVIGNQYQTFTTMWTMYAFLPNYSPSTLLSDYDLRNSGYVISQIPSQMICTRGTLYTFPPYIPRTPF